MDDYKERRKKFTFLNGGTSLKFMFLDFFIPFLSIFIAEFGDKTQLAVLSMSSKSKHYVQIFFGTMLAFLVIDGLAIYFAQEIAMYLPMFWIKIISGCLFLLFGIVGLLAKEKSEDAEKKKKFSFLRKFKSPFFSMFFLIFFAEFGDKSQIAAGLFASIYNPVFVFMGVFLALAALTGLAMYLGTILFKKIKKELIEKTANLTFILLGAFALFSLLLF